METPLFKAAYNLSFATWEVLICRGAKSQIANEDGYTPKSIAMKQIGAGPFRFGPDSDEVLNNIQPKSDAEKHFIQWLKNECPPNCRTLIKSHSLFFQSTSLSLRSRSKQCQKRTHSKETSCQKEEQFHSSLSSNKFQSSSSSCSTSTLHDDQLLSTIILRTICNSNLLCTY